MKLTIEVDTPGCDLKVVEDLTKCLYILANLPGSSSPEAGQVWSSLADKAVDMTVTPVAVEKPKRKRRTKAQIEADRVADVEKIDVVASAVEKIEAVVSEEEEEATVGKIETTIAPPGTPYSAEDVKAEVVAAVGRLTADGDENPTAPVVAVLQKSAGVKRVCEIAPEKYAETIAALKSVGSIF